MALNRNASHIQSPKLLLRAWSQPKALVLMGASLDLPPPPELGLLQPELQLCLGPISRGASMPGLAVLSRSPSQ